MISNLQFRFRDLFFDSDEFFSRFLFRSPPSSTRYIRQAGSQLHGLARAVLDISRLVQQMDKNKSGHQTQ
jgi:hypothetical protein